MSSVWVVLITFIVMLGLIGGGYYYFSSQHKENKKDAEKQIDSLRNELAKAKKENVASSLSTTTPAPTSPCAASSSSFKTYTNSTYGYCFEYPKTYGLIDYLYDSQTDSRVSQYRTVIIDKEALPENYVKTQSEYPAVWLAIGANDEKFTAESVRAQAGSDSIQEMTIDGHPAWKVVGSAPSMLDETYSTHIYTNSDDYGIAIWWTNSNAAGAHDAAIDTIIASLRWL